MVAGWGGFALVGGLKIFQIFCRFAKNRVIIEGFADRSGVERKTGSVLGFRIVNNLQPISVGV